MPCDLHDANHDAGSLWSGVLDLHTLAGAAPMASAGVKNSSITYISIFTLGLAIRFYKMCVGPAIGSIVFFLSL